MMAGTWRAAAHRAVVFLGVGAALFAQLGRAQEPTQAYRAGHTVQTSRSTWFFIGSSATPLPEGTEVTIVGDGSTRNGQHYVTVRKSNGQTGELPDRDLEEVPPSASARLPPPWPPTQESTQAAADPGQPAELLVSIGWTRAGEKPGTESHGVTPHIVVAPDHLIITSTNLFMMEASARANPVDATPSSCNAARNDVRAYFVCQEKEMARGAVFLPLAVGPQKCKDIEHPDLLLRLCVTMLKYQPDRFRLEFEEAQEVKYVPYETCIQPYSATICYLSVARARFDLTLNRDAAGKVAGCAVYTFAAFSFYSQNSPKMVPVDRIKIEHCAIVVADKVVHSQ
jgi:hypothetical protein